MRRARTASYAGVITFALLCTSAAAQDPPSAVALDASSSWADLLAADLSTCAEMQCASGDDRACASTCDASRTASPSCREVDCGSCPGAATECDGEGCGERVCVLCAWPGASDDVSAVCHASAASQAASPAGGRVVPAAQGAGAVEQASMTTATQRPSWALYEVKGHRYRLLTSGVHGAALTPALPEQARSDAANGVRERIGKMGMLALIHGSRERGDDAIAHLFSVGGGFEESVRSSLESPITARELPGPQHTPFDSGPAVHDVRALLFERSPLVTRDKRASVVTARLAGDFLIDIDGKLDGERAKRALARSRDAFQLCYETAFKAADAASGTLAVAFDVDRAGRVVGVSLTEDELDSDALSLCVLSTMKSLRFPSHESDEMSFSAAISFEHGS